MRKLLLLILISILCISLVNADDDMLELNDFDIWVDGDRADVDPTGGEVTDAEPDSEIKLQFQLKNLWEDDIDDHDIEDIEVDIEIDNFCRGNDDQELSDDLRDLDPDEKLTETYYFYIPKCADPADDYYLDFDIKGEDQDGTVYRHSLRIPIEINREDHEIDFPQPVLTPTTVDCGDNIQIDVDMHNIGSNDERVGLLIINNDLEINEFNFIELDFDDYYEDDNFYNASFIFNIPLNATAGQHEIKAMIEYRGTIEDKTHYLDLEVQNCVETEEEKDVSELLDEIINEEETPNETIEEPAVIIEETTEEKSNTPPMYLILMAIIIFVLVVALIGLVIILMSK